jgi:SAM-dependent methyltransferase
VELFLMASSTHPIHIGQGEPSPWVTRHAQILPPGGEILDVACGHGRHVRWLQGHGFHVTGLDRDREALESLQGIATATICADIETPGGWPCPGRQFDAVIVTNYLWRPLWETLRASVKPGGWLIYETFGHAQTQFGRPTRAEFLLDPAELLRVFGDWQVLSFEEGLVKNPLRHVQRIAVRSPSGEAINRMNHLPPEIPQYEG